MKIVLVLFAALFLTWNGNAQLWYEVSVPTGYNLNAIDFPSNTVGYIVGDSTTILKTTDGGITWQEVNHSGLFNSNFSHEIVDIDFVDEVTGFIAILNDNEGVYKTSDGGLTWTPAANNMSNMCYKSSVYANSGDDYFVGGAGCFQKRSNRSFC